MTRQLKYSTGVIYKIPINEKEIKIIDGREYVPLDDLLSRLVVEKKWANVMKDSVKPTFVRKKVIKNKGIKVMGERAI